MTGAILVIVFMVVVFPIGLFLSGALIAALFGWRHVDEARALHEGSELLDLDG